MRTDVQSGSNDGDKTGARTRTQARSFADFRGYKGADAQGHAQMQAFCGEPRGGQLARALRFKGNFSA